MKKVLKIFSLLFISISFINLTSCIAYEKDTIILIKQSENPEFGKYYFECGESYVGYYTNDSTLKIGDRVKFSKMP